MQLREAWLEDLADSAPIRLRIATGLSIAAFVSFAAVDPMLVDELLPLFVVRAIIVILLAALFGASFTSLGRRQEMGVLACYVTGGGVLAVTMMTGAGASPYHQALLLTFLGYAVLMPWSGAVAALAFAPLVAIYDVLCVTVGDTGDLGEWVTKNAVLWTCVEVSVVIVFFSERSRREAFSDRWQLDRVHQELKSLDEAKSRFFANLSHELRTPLTLALAPVEVLLEQSMALTKTQREHLRIIEKNGLRLLKRVDDLLELSRLEASEIRLRIEPTDLSSMLGELLAQLRPLAARKRIVLNLAVPESTPTVPADRSHLERVLLNILGNALKFTPEGGNISVRVEVAPHAIWVMVQDSGPGIPEEHLNRVFERFHQVDDSSTREQQGTGIGLALTREIVSLHGGTVSAANGPNGGALFSLSMPLELPSTVPLERQSLAKPPPPKEGLPEWHAELRNRDGYRLGSVEDATERRIVPRVRPSTRPSTVLIVEDNTDLVRFIASLLQPHYAVLAATDGEQGLTMAQNRAPDLVITDLMMPKLNGVELIEALRSSPQTESLPIILLTAHADVDQRIEAQAGGADGYLSKPFHGRELLAMVGRLLKRQEDHLALVAQEQDAAMAVMARGVAHEVLNPLGFILSALVLLRETAEESAQDDLELKEIVSDAYDAGAMGVERVRNAVQELREFGGAPREEPRAVPLNDVVQRVLVMFKDVAFDADAEPVVLLRRGDLERVLLNLLLNATQATGDEGTVDVTTKSKDGRALLIVRDNGPGIEEEHLVRIFDPFYTTKDKDSGQNSGLGLALSRQIVRRHDGHLTVWSKPGKGATFTVDLPLLNAQTRMTMQ